MRPMDNSLKSFYIISGTISPENINKLKDYDISDSNSKKLLENCIRNNSNQNYLSKNSYFNFLNDRRYNLNSLKETIENLNKDDPNEYSLYIQQMEQKYEYIESNYISKDNKKACALALVYYISDKNNSDRVNNNINALIKKQNDFNEKYYSILYYLSKALDNLPLYSGYTIRCVNMDNDILQDYVPGTIITWINFISSKIGKEPSSFLKSRNAWFYIYSLNSREISKLGVYSSEREVLYSPFSHFLVFKKESKDDKTMIYMRQIEIRNWD